MDQLDRFTFGPFCLDSMASHLLKDDAVVPLRQWTLAVLRYLAERPYQLVTTEELYQQVWPERHAMGCGMGDRTMLQPRSGPSAPLRSFPKQI